jgi:O-antigen/teichoic acid export membrane protein
MSVRRSLTWAFSGQFINFTVQFAGSVVLARLLSPYEMGITAIAMAAFGIVSVFTAFGVGSYVVRDPDLQPQTLETAFTVNAALLCGLSLLILALSFGAGWILKEPRAAGVLRVAAISNLFGIISFRPSVMLQREMQFKRMSLIGIISGVVGSSSTVAFAFAGASYMSVAYGGLIASAMGTALTFAMGRQHASYRLSTSSWRSITIFGLQIMSISGVAVLVGRLCDLILGRTLGVAALGIYGRANSLSGLIFENVYGTATRVVFVQLSKDFRETGELRTTFLRSLQIITAFMWPLLAGLALLSRPAIFTLYGEKWLMAAVPFSILLVAQIITLGFGMNWELFVLRGETGRQAKYEITRSITGLALFSIGCHFSLAAAAASRIVDSLVGLILYAPQVRRLANTAAYEVSGIYRESGILALAATLPTLVIMITHDWSARTPLLQIFVAVALGIGLWSIALALLDHPLKDEAFMLWRKIRRKTETIVVAPYI